MLYFDQENDEQTPDKPTGVSKFAEQFFVVLSQNSYRNNAKQQRRNHPMIAFKYPGQVEVQNPGQNEPPKPTCYFADLE